MIEGCILWVFSGVNKIVCHCLPPLMTNLRPPLWTMARHTYPDYSNFGFIIAAVVMLDWKHSVNMVVSSFLLWQKSWPKYFTWTEWGLSWRQSSNICVCSVKTGKWSKLKSYCIVLLLKFFISVSGAVGLNSCHVGAYNGKICLVFTSK